MRDCRLNCFNRRVAFVTLSRPGRPRFRWGGSMDRSARATRSFSVGSAMSRLWCCRSCRDFLPHLTRQRSPSTLAFTFACGWPLLPVRPRSLDLSIEFSEAGIAIFNRTVATASDVLRLAHHFSPTVPLIRKAVKRFAFQSEPGDRQAMQAGFRSICGSGLPLFQSPISGPVGKPVVQLFVECGCERRDITQCM
jgi:hypothetical protein